MRAKICPVRLPPNSEPRSAEIWPKPALPISRLKWSESSTILGWFNTLVKLAPILKRAAEVSLGDNREYSLTIYPHSDRPLRGRRSPARRQKAVCLLRPHPCD